MGMITLHGEEVKVGDRVWLTNRYYTSKEDILKLAFKTEPIEPYLPSEIEREVKE